MDEAWGAYLPFHEDLPAWGMDAGADLVVTSVHTMGAVIEQSSLFHLEATWCALAHRRPGRLRPGRRLAGPAGCAAPAPRHGRYGTGG